MIKYPITIELLSETIFGNGESRNGVVNREILLDKNGLPYFSGKTFKGYLKNAINTILSPYYKNNGSSSFEERVSNLFGSYDTNRHSQKEGKLRFNNFYIDKEIASVFLDENNKNDKEIILATLTDIRFAIRVDEEKEIAKEKNLRTSRVLKRGLVFVGYIECENELSEDEYTLIKQATAATKHLGINKSRGKGLVRIEIGSMQNDLTNNKLVSENIDLNKKDFEYIFYELDLKESVKVGDSQSKYDYEQSKLYLTGSTIRGAILNKYLKCNKIQDGSKNKKFLSILKKVYFYDSYPIYEENNNKYFSFPTPNIFRMTKDKDKEDSKYYKKEEFSVVFNKETFNNERRVIKLKKGVFSYYKKGTLYQFNIKKDYRVHHSQQVEESNIFRYESISKDQKFYGIIDVSKIDNELKIELLKLLNENSIMYLGGSRTSGYGRTQISKVETIKDFYEVKEKLTYLKSQDNIKNKLDIYFLSDTILRDENHQISSEFSYEDLKEGLNVEIKNKDKKEKILSEITPVIITGYNSVWQSNLPHVYGIEKGSVIRIKCDEVLEKNIDRFIKVQHGDRKTDGLGRVIINPNFLNPLEIQYVDYNYTYDKNMYSRGKELYGSLIEDIKRRSDKILKDKKIKQYVVQTKKTMESNNTKVNNIIAVIDKCLLLEDEVFEKFKQELESLNKTTQNKDRNESNTKILDYKILDEYTLRTLKDFAKGERKDIVEKITECKIIEDGDVDELFLRIIRESFYYSLKQTNRGR